MTYIEELRDVIRKLHGVDSTHIENVPLKEIFRGETIWEGAVKVFELHDHPRVKRLYAWAHSSEDPAKPRRHVTVLHCHPLTSAREAVRAYIVQEFRRQGPAPNAKTIWA